MLMILEIFFFFTFGFDLNWMANKTFLNLPWIKCSPILWVHAKIDAFSSFLKKLVTEGDMKRSPHLRQVSPSLYGLSSWVQGLMNISFLNLGVQNSPSVQIRLVKPGLFCTLKSIIFRRKNPYFARKLMLHCLLDSELMIKSFFLGLWPSVFKPMLGAVYAMSKQTLTFSVTWKINLWNKLLPGVCSCTHA